MLKVYCIELKVKSLLHWAQPCLKKKILWRVKIEKNNNSNNNNTPNIGNKGDVGGNVCENNIIVFECLIFARYYATLRALCGLSDAILIKIM